MKKKGWETLGRVKNEPVTAQMGGEVPALGQSRAFKNLGSDVYKGRRKGHQRGTLTYLATSMNSTSGGLVCKRLGGGASLVVEAVELSSASSWERMVDSVCVFTNENLHLSSWADEEANEFVAVFGLLDQVRSWIRNLPAPGLCSGVGGDEGAGTRQGYRVK